MPAPGSAASGTSGSNGLTSGTTRGEDVEGEGEGKHIELAGDPEGREINMARRPVAGAARLGSVRLFVDVTADYQTLGQIRIVGRASGPSSSADSPWAWEIIVGDITVRLQRIVFGELNAKQKETYNFQKVAALLAGLWVQLHQAGRRLARHGFPRIPQRRRHNAQGATQVPCGHQQEVPRQGPVSCLPCRRALVPRAARQADRYRSRDDTMAPVVLVDQGWRVQRRPAIEADARSASRSMPSRHEHETRRRAQRERRSSRRGVVKRRSLDAGCGWPRIATSAR